MFDPFKATFDEAFELSKNEEKDINPIFQWSAAQEIMMMEETIKAGNGYEILKCIRKCVTYQLIAPKWLAFAFNSKFDSVNHYRAKSWEDPQSFGLANKKGTNINARRKKLDKMHLVYQEIRQIRSHHPNIPVDAGLFEQVGEKFGIGKTLASEYYYSAKSRFNFE